MGCSPKRRRQEVGDCLEPRSQNGPGFLGRPLLPALTGKPGPGVQPFKPTPCGPGQGLHGRGLSLNGRTWSADGVEVLSAHRMLHRNCSPEVFWAYSGTRVGPLAEASAVNFSVKPRIAYRQKTGVVRWHEDGDHMPRDAQVRPYLRTANFHQQHPYPAPPRGASVL